jgi:hypothetical protein
LCQEDKRKQKTLEGEVAIPWRLKKGKGGPKKKVSTSGYFCPNVSCENYAITDERTHALVGYGTHGTHEEIRDFKCQACGKKFTARRNTILYRLKSHSALIEKILWLLALGVDASALEEVFGVREVTIRTWLCRSGMQGRKLHERFLAELKLVHMQLDEAFGKAKGKAKVKNGGQDMWLWVAHDASTKLIPVLQVGGRNQEMAFSVVHELKRRLAVGCVPVFSTDGLKQYYYALTAHFGKWEWVGGKKAVWILLSDFVYSQEIVFAKQTYIRGGEERWKWNGGCW